MLFKMGKITLQFPKKNSPVVNTLDSDDSPGMKTLGSHDSPGGEYTENYSRFFPSRLPVVGRMHQGVD